MSHRSQLSPWLEYLVPNHLETRDKHGASRLEDAEQPTPEVTISTRQKLFHSFATAPLQHLLPTTNAAKPARKVPDGAMSRRNQPLQPRRTGPRYFSRRKIRHSRFSNGPQASRVNTMRESSSAATPDSQSGRGLGITNGPITQVPAPAMPSKFGEEQSPCNIAQRLEKRPLNYESLNNPTQGWLLEIICLITSTLCMAAIISVLIFLQNEKLPRWPLGLTLNAYISVLSKVAGAALLVATAESLGQLKWNWFQRPKKLVDFEIFDSASRGPWGAFILLLRTKAQSLAALGAIITILALAVDPFFQQVVDFPERWTSSSWNSSVARVRVYDSPSYSVFANGEEIPLQEGFIKSVTDKYITANGTHPVRFDNVTKPEVPVFCPTSNCTWPAYESLGVCSSCTDVSDLLTFGCLSTRVDWVRNLTGVNTMNTYPNATQCGYFLNITSEIPILMSGYLAESIQSEAGSAAAGEALLMRALPLITNPGRLPLYGDGSIKFKHIRHKIQDGIFASILDGLIENAYQNKTPIIQECMLAWCVRRFSASWYLGNFEENITNTYLSETAVPGSYPYRFDLEDDYPSEYSGDVVVETTFDNSSSTYSLSNISAIRTVNIFDDIFPSFYTAINSSDQPLYRFQAYWGPPRHRTLQFNPWVSPNNITKHLERLSMAVTDALRNSNSSELFLGQAFVMEAYVAVRWEWLCLPIGLLILGCIFLAATIYASSGQRAVWKTSAIATLIYNLPYDTQRKIRSPTLAGTPRARAMEIMAELQSRDSRVLEGLQSSTNSKEARTWPPPEWI